MTTTDLHLEIALVLEALAGSYADRYISECLRPTLRAAVGAEGDSLAAIRASFGSPYKALQAILGHYAFARRGKEKHDLNSIAVEALHLACGEEGFPFLLQQEDGTSVWREFELRCSEIGIKAQEQLNRGVIAGLPELAQEIYRVDGTGNIAEWIVNALDRTGRLEPEFLRIVDIRGVGPKMTSLFLRDIVFLFELEDSLDHADRLFVQPVDKWMRMLAPYVIDEEGSSDLADWVLAGKYAKYARRAGVSGIRLNMGASYFGSKVVRGPEHLRDAIAQILS